MKRALRRTKERSKQKHRIETASNLGIVWESPRYKGRMKHNHYGCGCPMCKPWRYGLENPYKHSERLRLLEDE